MAGYIFNSASNEVDGRNAGQSGSAASSCLSNNNYLTIHSHTVNIKCQLNGTTLNKQHFYQSSIFEYVVTVVHEYIWGSAAQPASQQQRLLSKWDSPPVLEYE